MADMYDELEPNNLEKNPAEEEILQILDKYKKITDSIDREALKLRQIGNKKDMLAQLDKLRQRADQDLTELAKSAENFARIAAPKSNLSGRELANNYIKNQSKYVDDDEGEVTQIFDLIPKDREKIKKITEKVTADMLRDVRMINDSWRKRFDGVVRSGINEVRGINLIKRPGIRGGTTTGKEIGSRLYQEIRNSGLKLIDSIGRKWEPDRYIRMFARTRTRELQTQGIENRMNDFGFDLVQISEHVDVDGMDICNIYEGNVYSLSGDHPDYPKLDARPPFHPNCAHVMTPWIEKYQNKVKENISSDKSDLKVSKEYKKLHPELNDDVIEKLEKTHLKVLERGKETGTEHLSLINKSDGLPAFKDLSGGKSSVEFTPELVDKLKKSPKNSIIMVHNHPGSSSFSSDDLKVLNNFDSIYSMTVEGHNGRKYSCMMSDGKKVNSDSKVNRLYSQHKYKHHEKFRDKVLNGELSSEEAWQEHSHELMTSLADELGWVYRRILPEGE